MNENVEKLKQRVEKAGNSSNVNTYRENMRKLGMVQANPVIPETKTEELRMFVEKVKAEYFLELCELDPKDERRETLAVRNQVRIPTHVEISSLKGAIDDAALPLKGELKALMDHVNSAMRAQAALAATHDAGGEDDEFVKWGSLAVAHSRMAKYYYDHLLKELGLDVKRTLG